MTTRADQIVRSIPEGVLTTNLERRILTFNPAAEELTGWPAEESLGRFCGEVLAWTVDGGMCQDRCPLTHALSELTATQVKEGAQVRSPVAEGRANDWAQDPVGSPATCTTGRLSTPLPTEPGSRAEDRVRGDAGTPPAPARLLVQPAQNAESMASPAASSLATRVDPARCGSPCPQPVAPYPSTR